MNSPKERQSNRFNANHKVWLFIAFTLGTLLKCGSLHAAYKNPLLKVLLFSSSDGIYLSNDQGLTLSSKGTIIGTGNKVLIIPDSKTVLIVNNTLSVKGILNISTSGETNVLNLKSKKQRRYLGNFEVRPFKEGAHLINHIPTESYLEGVLNAEISTRWHMEVVKAQAVISRTFALYKRKKRLLDPWHLSSGHYDQVYKGSDIADDRGRAAIRSTTGIVVGYKGHLAQTFYHSNCGGKTADPGKIWQYQLPYLKVQPVPFGKNDPRYHWETTITDREMKRILKKMGLPTAVFNEIIISKRTSSNRVFELSVIGQKTSKVSGYAFRKASGYKRIQSLLFNFKRIPGGFHFKGKGNGHGVGLSQWSAKEMAEEGYKYHEILFYFYRDTELMRHQG